jgi:hypothetical protein
VSSKVGLAPAALIIIRRRRGSLVALGTSEWNASS